MLVEAAPPSRNRISRLRRGRGLAGLLVVLLSPALASADPVPPAAMPPVPQLRPPEVTPLQLASYEYAAGAGAAMLSVPLTMLVGSSLGTRSPDLIASLLPGVLLFLVVPPLAVTGAEYFVGRRLAPERTRLLHPAIWAAVGVNTLALVAGSLAGVWTGDTLSFSLFTVAEMLVMPLAVTLVMHYRPARSPAAAPPPAPPPTTASDGSLKGARVLLPEGRRVEGLVLPAVSVPLFAFRF